MDRDISELVVLQIIYSMLIARTGKSSGSDSTSDGSSSSGSGVLPKISLVKLTNEIQNNVLVNQMVRSNESKLDINDILRIIRNLFKGQRTSLVDGQLSFHNLQLEELREDLLSKYEEFKSKQIESINSLEDKILQSGSSQTVNSNISTPAPASSSSTMGTKKNKNIIVVDPKREKLLQLYRDTVLNKLQGKNKLFDELYERLDKMELEGNQDIVKEAIEIERIKNDTPSSVHDLQLILQRSVCDGLMRFPIGSENWKLAKQVQLDFDDTVQFMRRALE